jgi:CheY-like chemotaxis protein
MRRALSVLVVDDDPASLHQIALQLDAAGFEVKSLSNAVETLSYLRATARAPDIILVDLWMPGLHGVALAQSIKADAHLSTIPLCAITGYAYNEEEVRRVTGVEGFLHKPLPWGEELCATLHDLIRQARRVRGAPTPAGPARDGSCAPAGGEGTAGESGTAPFVPLGEAAERLGLSIAEARRQLYVVVVDQQLAVRAEDVARLEQLAASAPGYARALRLAFARPPWCGLSWQGRTAHFNRGLPAGLRINKRALSRIALGHDRELTRAIRVLLALELKLGLSLKELYRGELEEEPEHRREEAIP